MRSCLRWPTFGSRAIRDLLNIPGALTLLRLPLAIAFPFVAAHPLRAFAVLGLAAVSDMLDGWLARRFRQQSRTGAIADAVLDKVFVLSVVLTLWARGALSPLEVMLLGTRDLGEILIALRVVVATRSLHLRSRQVANTAGKLATAMQFLAVVAVVFGSVLRPWCIGMASVAGLLAAAIYWRREGVLDTPAAPELRRDAHAS